ncbi:MAG: hypothetical protein ACI9OF_001066, partial [Saprospiraceae bacterium]
YAAHNGQLGITVGNTRFDRVGRLPNTARQLGQSDDSGVALLLTMSIKNGETYATVT